MTQFKRILKLAGALFAGALATTPAVAADIDFGKVGEPVKLVVGYQPYYTESWSGVIMRSKKFYEKYLPKGSTVEFQIGLQGAIIVNNLLAGKQHIGYNGDMPAIVSTTKQDVADIRLVAVVGMGWDQCNAFLVRTDAPKFANDQEAIKWLNGKTVAVPKGSCTDRFAQAVFKRAGIQPSAYLNQNIEVITSNFRAGKLDAAVMWEPTTSRLVLEGLARKVATGVLGQRERRRISGHARRPDQAAARRRQGVAQRRARRAALLRRPEERDGSHQDGARADHRLLGTRAVDGRLRHVSQGRRRHADAHHPALRVHARSDGADQARLRVPVRDQEHQLAARCRPEAVMPEFAQAVLKERGITAPLGEIKQLPDSAYTGSK